jgi:hypothetical protein
VLQYPELHAELKENCIREVQKFNLDEPARKTKEIYEKAMAVVR